MHVLQALDAIEIVKRLLLAAVIAGMIGFDREFKNRPAGIRTHILVCLGAAIVALIQDQIGLNALQVATEHPNLASVLRSDQARLTAQVISGIGFLGAGTIIVTKRSVFGLTTAASIWAVACLGIACGMGYYRIAIVGFIAIIFVLSLLNKVIVIPSIKKLEIKFIHKEDTMQFISDYFAANEITVRDVDFDVDISNNQRIYTNVYSVELPKRSESSVIIEDLSTNDNVLRIRLVDV